MYVEAIDKYCLQFPEVIDKKEKISNLEISDKEKLALFLQYSYWYFDEYYSYSMHEFAKDYDNVGFNSKRNEFFIGILWSKSVFQIDFYYQYRKYTDIFKDKSYIEFSNYNSLNSEKLNLLFL